jgi:hypothetical protein
VLLVQLGLVSYMTLHQSLIILEKKIVVVIFGLSNFWVVTPAILNEWPCSLKIITVINALNWVHAQPIKRVLPYEEDLRR